MKHIGINVTEETANNFKDIRKVLKMTSEGTLEYLIKLYYDTIAKEVK